jgi:hypothetical protein
MNFSISALIRVYSVNDREDKVLKLYFCRPNS